MTSRRGELEKSTRTDLLYGLAQEDGSDLALLTLARGPREPQRGEDAPTDEPDATPAQDSAARQADLVRQLAATRADSSLTGEVQADGPAGEAAKRARRWRYAEGFIPPEREAATDTDWEAYTVADRPAPRTLGKVLRSSWRASQAWWISFGVHVVLLPLLALLSMTASKGTWNVVCEIVPNPAPPQMQVINIPPAAALPTPIEYVSVPISMEISLPEVEVERGALAAALAEQALLAKSQTAAAFPEIEELFDPGGARGKAAGTAKGDGAQFFGLPAAGNKFVFVVDCSLSMRDDNRWGEACTELNAAIERLKPEQLFYVILFDGQVHRMFNHDERQAALFPATDENKALFREWLLTARLGYETRPFLSVVNAIGLRPDAVYLLSDGDFKDPTADFLKRNNRPFDDQGNPLHQVAVHTIVFHSREGLATMGRIARENGGKMLFIRRF